MKVWRGSFLLMLFLHRKAYHVRYTLGTKGKRKWQKQCDGANVQSPIMKSTKKLATCIVPIAYT